MIPALIGTLTFIQTLMLTGLSVAREREQGTFDQLLVTPFRPVGIMIGKALPPMFVGIVQATLCCCGATLVPHSFCWILCHLVCGIEHLFTRGGRHGSVVIVGFRDDATGDVVYLLDNYAIRAVVRPHHAGEQHAGVAAVRHVHQSFALRHRNRSSGLSPRVGLGLLFPELWPLAVIATVTLSVSSWMFRHRLA